MPKVKTESFYKVDHKRDINIQFRYDVMVSTDGTFYTYLPANILLMLEQASIILDTNLHKKKAKPGYLSGKDIPSLTKRIEEIIADYLSTTIVSETVIIRYSINTQCAYCLADENNVVPNGNYVKDFNSTEAKTWKFGTSEPYPHLPLPFGIMVYAKPFLKRILRYKSGKLITEYASMHYAGKKKDGTEWIEQWGQWLDDIPSITHTGEVHEIAYSEDAALFFVNLIKSICMLNERIKDFIKPEGIQFLIDNHTQKLLG
jgi:hypothetical protein